MLLLHPRKAPGFPYSILVDPKERVVLGILPNWFQEILNSMDAPWTNGYIEGCNNKTKVLKRVSYGMRNFNNFRKRILFCNT
jgi:transposase